MKEEADKKILGQDEVGVTLTIGGKATEINILGHSDSDTKEVVTLVASDIFAVTLKGSQAEEEEQRDEIIKAIEEGAANPSRIDPSKYTLGEQLGYAFNHLFKKRYHPDEFKKLEEDDVLRSLLISSIKKREGLNLLEIEEGSDIDKKLQGYFDAFVELYDPMDSDHTLARFVEDLRNEEEFAEHDVETWFIDKEKEIFRMLRGYDIEENGRTRRVPRGKNHIAQIVDGLYIEKGKKNPLEFIRIFLPTFMSKFMDTITVDTKLLNYFSENMLPRVATRDVSLAKLHELLREVCVEEFTDEITGLMIVPENSTFEEDLDIEMARVISENTVVRSPFAQAETLFENPGQAPYNFRRWYKEDGSFDHRAYLKGMGSIVGVMPDDVDFLKKINAVFEDAFERYSRYLEMVGINYDKHKELAGKITYPELVAIVNNEGKDMQLRFTARVIVELAMLIHRAKGISAVVHANANRAHLEEKFATKLLPDLDGENIIYFKDVIDDANPENNIVEIIPSRDLKKHDIREIDSVDLEPVSLFYNDEGVNCHILPFEEDFVLANGYSGIFTHRIGIKTLDSMIAKAIRRKEDPSDQKDVYRMTFVARDQKHKGEIMRMIDNYIRGFGVVHKFEGSCNGLVGAEPSKGKKKKENKSKSKEYKADKFLATVRAPDATTGMISGKELIKRKESIRLKLNPELRVAEAIQQAHAALMDVNWDTKISELEQNRNPIRPGQYGIYELLKMADELGDKVTKENTVEELMKIAKDSLTIDDLQDGINDMHRIEMELINEAEENITQIDHDIEIRFMTFEELAADKSKHHPGGHDKYKDRRKTGVVERLLPRQLYPELYEQKTTEVTRNDFYNRGEWVLKSRNSSSFITS